jgi:hypothetical protein
MRIAERNKPRVLSICITNDHTETEMIADMAKVKSRSGAICGRGVSQISGRFPPKNQTGRAKIPTKLRSARWVTRRRAAFPQPANSPHLVFEHRPAQSGRPERMTVLGQRLETNFRHGVAEGLRQPFGRQCSVTPDGAARFLVAEQDRNTAPG